MVRKKGFRILQREKSHKKEFLMRSPVISVEEKRREETMLDIDLLTTPLVRYDPQNSNKGSDAEYYSKLK